MLRQNPNNGDQTSTTPNLDILCLALKCYKFSALDDPESTATWHPTWTPSSNLNFILLFSPILLFQQLYPIRINNNYTMDFSHLTPEQVTQLRALLLPESPALNTSTPSPSPFSSLLPPPTQAPQAASAAVPQLVIVKGWPNPWGWRVGYGG